MYLFISYTNGYMVSETERAKPININKGNKKASRHPKPRLVTKHFPFCKVCLPLLDIKAGIY